MMRRLPPIAALGLVALAALAGCNRRTTVVIPNRVLDRPLDVALACVSTPDGELVEPASLNECSGSISDCGAYRTPHLVGFIANSERNEVAMFRKCANSLVDMDRESPGYQFVPVGELPSSISVSDDSCWAAVANYGSCDLSVLDVPGLAASAVEVEVDGEPSSRVARVIPRRSDGVPLASRPGQVIAVPRDLSNGDAIGDDGFGIDVTGGLCGAGSKASVFVTFPACHLVAEVDLRTERILQSRQIVRLGDGGYDVVDSGQSPECPVECAELYGDEPIPDIEGDPEGVFPLPMALVVDPHLRGVDDPNSPDQSILDTTLFVGGAGADSLFEIPIEGTSFSDTALELELSGSSGILTIRPTPAMRLDFDGGAGEVDHQFLYVIVGDGSTRVVRRDLGLDRYEIGTECDTQVDPTQVTATICNEAAYPGDNPPDRRPFAQGPGIRAPNGATVTDWSFQVVEPAEDDVSIRSPFTTAGVVGIGVTNVGRLVFATFGQFSTGVQVPESLDPLETINAQILPHSLWPALDPALGDPSALPRLDDNEPTRILTGELNEANANKVLAPTLRRIDLGYVDPCVAEAAGGGGFCTTATSPLAGVGVSPIANADGLGDENDESALYQSAVAKVIPRDFREWRGGTWDIYWEGEIPGTSSSAGQIYCDTPSPGDSPVNAGVYCFTVNPDGAQIVDTGSSFCDDGVLAGDKVLIFGCSETNDCGVGQICLRDEASQSTGICISGEVRDEFGEDALREACAEYISDPCGSPLREFVISRAFQTRLHLQAIDVPKTAYIRTREVDGAVVTEERERRLTCLPDQPDGGCKVDAECPPVEGELDDEGNVVDPPVGLCVDGLCRGICDEGAGDECVLRRLPGPRCFGELLRYQVRARNSYVVRGPGAYSFLSQRVRADEEGECYEDPTVSTLLTSRIRVGADEDDTRYNASWPIAECPSGKIPETGAPNPCFITDPRPAILDGNSPARLFHKLFLGDAPISAIRYSNPMFSLIFDLTSANDLAATISGTDYAWPPEFTAFKRSRIPRNHRESFSTLTGYSPYNEGVTIGSVPLVGPVRVINAPESGTVYVVDASGAGGSGGLRGQVMRVFLSPNVVADVDFIVR